MPDAKPIQYGLDAARYAEVDDKLERAAAYFAPRRLPICDELRDKASPLAKTSHAAMLRLHLKHAQEIQEQGRIVQQRLYGKRSPEGAQT